MISLARDIADPPMKLIDASNVGVEKDMEARVILIDTKKLRII